MVDKPKEMKPMKLATLCYVEKDNQYLMLHRNKKSKDMHKDLWVGLGGKIEAGESPEECVIREVYEESGITITNLKLKGILTFPSDGLNGEDWYVFLFAADYLLGDLKQSDEGDLAWVDKNKLDELPMHKADPCFIKLLQEDRGIFSAKYVYVSGVLKDSQVNFYK